MIEEFIRYTELSDREILEVFSKADNDMPEAERLFSHVLNAQHIWVNRIEGLPLKYEIWQVHPVEKFESISSDNFKLINASLNKHDLQSKITYHDSRGNEYQNTVAEMFMQMLNHSTYHRGQIVSMLKKEGFTPPVTDYIYFKRKNLL
ncbi:DinB family protein [Pedobacter aquatilis]|uniref:DinB family protein n=1 Tax=Pedobacter aquatilis TaxID=351343 RepID=UPI0025B4D8AB|nr:DinB family protein [Pedobacter aquatilis]MDN3587226.1 DinB family protein [Pedobacter aquatilis]